MIYIKLINIKMDYAQKIILKLLEEYSQEELAEILDDKQPNIFL